MPAETLQVNLAQVARAQGNLAQVSRPQAGDAFGREYEFGNFIATFAGVQIEDFDGNDLITFTA